MQRCNGPRSTLRQELGALRQQLEETRQLKDTHEKTGIVEKEKSQRLSAALLQAEADNRDIIARYQQLELKLTHAEAELDTLSSSEQERNVQLQVPHPPSSYPTLTTPCFCFCSIFRLSLYPSQPFCVPSARASRRAATRQHRARAASCHTSA